MALAHISYVVLDVPNITSKQSFLGLFQAVSGLEVTWEVHEYREGGNNDFVHRLPGRMTYPNLVLSWGLIDDDALLKWFMQTAQEAQRQEITLSFASTPSDLSRGARRFTFTDAFPVHWSGPQLHGTVHDPSSWGESLEIAHSGLKL